MYPRDASQGSRSHRGAEAARPPRTRASRARALLLAVVVAALLCPPLAPATYTQNTYDLVTPGVLTIGTHPEFPPFEDVEESEIVGFDIDLSKEIASRLGLTCSVVSVPFDSLTERLLGGSEFDMIASAFTITSKRDTFVDYSVPYHDAAPGDQYAFAFKPADGALREAVNTALGALYADGTYDVIYRRWLGEPSGLSFYAPSVSEYSSATVGGYLRDAGGTGMASALVQVQSRSGSTWRNVGATTMTDADGRYSMRVTPKTKTAYRAQFAGLESLPADTSVTRTVLPRVRLTRTTSWKALKRNKTYQARGYIEPAHKVVRPHSQYSRLS